MSSKMSRLATFAGAFIVTAVLIAAVPQAFAQSCGDLGGGGNCDGPYPFGNNWYFSGGGSACRATCTLASSSGATGCFIGADFGGNNLSAYFSGGATSAAFCAFNCGTRGSCKIKAGDGLPVELLAFGIE